MIEVMISVVIMGIVASASATMIYMFQNENKKAAQGVELATITSELKTIWSDELRCNESFAGRTISRTGANAPGTASAAQRRSVTTLYGAPIDTYNSANLINVRDFDFRLISGNPLGSNFVARVNVLPLSKQNLILGHLRPKTILMQLELNAGNQIVNCNSLSDANSSYEGIVELFEVVQASGSETEMGDYLMAMYPQVKYAHIKACCDNNGTDPNARAFFRFFDGPTELFTVLACANHSDMGMCDAHIVQIPSSATRLNIEAWHEGSGDTTVEVQLLR